MREKFASFASKVFGVVLAAGLLVSTCAPALAAENAPVVTASAFQDVPAGSAVAEAVTYVSGRGLMKGTSKTTFSPNQTLTRAMFVTILAREAGVRTDYYYMSDFDDVKSGSWCSGAIAWAAQCGITNGYSSTLFGANQPVTREQMAAMIARTVKQFRISLATEDGAAFVDEGKASSYAKDGLELMRQTGIMQGDENGNFNPKREATRAQTAQTFMRLDQAVAKVSAAADKSARVISAAGAPCTVTERVLVRDFRNDIRYPELSGLLSADVQKTWNAKFLSSAQTAKAEIPSGTVYQGTFAVTQNDQSLLSITETIDAYMDGGMHGSANLATWNLDPATGKQLRLSDLCDTAALAKALLSGQGYEIRTSWGETAKADEISLSDILTMSNTEEKAAAVKKLLDSFDSSDPSNFGGYTYWVDHKPCLVFPVSHAAGDYCVIQMNNAYAVNH